MDDDLDRLSVKEIEEHVEELEQVLNYYRRYLIMKRPLFTKKIKIVRPGDFKHFASALRIEKQLLKDAEVTPKKLRAVS